MKNTTLCYIEKEIIQSIEQLKNDKDIEITLKDGKVNGHFIINKE